MQLHSMIVDGFLDDFEGVRGWMDNYAQFTDVTNPVDGVSYPGICSEIPEAIRNDVHLKLCLALATNQVNIRTMFARLSTHGAHVPHQAHNDASMGMFSCMVYLNRLDDSWRGGTDLVDHNFYEMEYGPQDEESLEMWKIDANDRLAWWVRSGCRMKPNRAFIFDSRLMHRAMPIGGFGDNAQNGRLVLTAFFDV